MNCWHFIQDILSSYRTADISLFHNFEPPPTGGGHQFMRALQQRLIAQGFRVENNTITPKTQACMFNSFNFDHRRLQRIKRFRPACRMIHRVDGPISVYRGFDDGTDTHIESINKVLAQATVFQSGYSRDMSREIGLMLQEPHVIIPNSPDPSIFHREGKTPFSTNRKIRLISTSWSDNPNKGQEVYQWLDQHLDWSIFEYTFIGRIRARLGNIVHIQPTDSHTVARHLQHSDIYITASRHDPCSNSLLEALACGLPALYLNSGGHGELVQQAGLAFDAPEQIPALLEQIAREYTLFQHKISLTSLEEIARRYLDIMGMSHA